MAKYNIIKTIEDDAPFGDVNWLSISFLTPNKLDALKLLDVKGFKVHNGYNTSEIANSDIKIIKTKKREHDVYLASLGKLHAWDDATKADEIEYEQKKLNDLEKTRRQNADKVELMKQHFKNEFQNNKLDRRAKKLKEVQQRLYDRGYITHQELEMLNDTTTVNDAKEKLAQLEKLTVEMDECFKTDYLDENDPVALKYGCISIYSPRNIGGLKTLCFKVRGLFQTREELDERITRLSRLYPRDRLAAFEVGKWTVFSETDGMDPTVQIKQLNYAMKVYLESLTHEKEEFDERKASMVNKANQEAAVTKKNNRREKRREKRQARQAEPPVASPVEPPKPVESLTTKPVDNAAIQNIIDYLNEPDLKKN